MINPRSPPSEHAAVWGLSIANSQSQRTLAYYFGRTSCSLASVQEGPTCTPEGSWWGIVTPHGRRTILRMKMLCSWMLRALENLAFVICRSRTIAFGAWLLSDTKKNIKGELRWQHTQKHTHVMYRMFWHDLNQAYRGSHSIPKQDVLYWMPAGSFHVFHPFSLCP